MKESSRLLTNDTLSTSPDWHAVADDRLAKLVQLDLECSAARGQLSALQAERHESEARHAEELRRAQAQRHALVSELEQLEANLAEALETRAKIEVATALRLETMRSEFLNSTSWRLTSPLRALSKLLRRGHSQANR